MAVIVTLLGICICGAFAGAAWWKRDELGGFMQSSRSHPAHSFRELQLDEEGGLSGAAISDSVPPGATPPAYANIVTATPI